MSLPYRQQHRLRGMDRRLQLSEPRLASMLNMFSRLNAGEAMPAGERRRRRLPGPVRALGHAIWAALRVCARALVACGRWLRPLGRPLRPCGRLLGFCTRRLLRPGGRLLCRISLCCLVRCRFLPVGFRLTVGSWLAAARPSAPSPPAAHRREP